MRLAQGVVVRKMNTLRLRTFYECARSFLEDEKVDFQKLVNLHLDLSWPEIPRAWALALFRASKRELRPSFMEDFAEFCNLLAFFAFGSTERAVLPPWFLKNFDTFFDGVVDGLDTLLANETNAALLAHAAQIRRVCATLLTMAEAAKQFSALDRLEKSSGAHVLLVAVNVPFRNAHTPTMLMATLVDTVSEAILMEGDSDLETWERAYGHFAGDERWRRFAHRCTERWPGLTTSAARLEKSVQLARDMQEFANATVFGGMNSPTGRAY